MKKQPELRGYLIKKIGNWLNYRPHLSQLFINKMCS